MKKLLILLTLLAILPVEAQEADMILRDRIAKQAGIRSLRAEFHSNTPPARAPHSAPEIRRGLFRPRWSVSLASR
jgi:hypothetical protein